MNEVEEVNISWSKIRTSDECHQKAYLSNRARSPVQDVRNFYAGNVADRIMRNWLSLDNPEEVKMSSMVEDQMIRSLSELKENKEGIVKWRHNSDRDDTRDFCKELLVKLQPILIEYVLPYQYQPAHRFRIPIQVPYLDGSQQTVYLVGEYDLLVKPDQYHVYDLKATKDNNYWKKTFGQLIFYDLSVLAGFGETTGEVGLIQPMCKDQFLRFTVTDKDRRGMLSRICKYAEDIWRGNTGPKDNTSGCEYCPVTHACSRYKAEIDVNGKRKIPLILGRYS